MKNRRTIMAVIPLVLVNIVAFAGQFAFIREHIHWPLIGQVIFALALESVALFLTAMAHEALMAEDSAYGLRILSYGFGAVIGIMNYSHYAPNMRPTFEAVATGLMSVASPFLWGIYSRRNSRDILKSKGLIESRAIKLGGLRWLLWPKRTWPVFRDAVWAGENNPATAITEWERGQEREALERPSDPRKELDAATSQAEAVRIALRDSGLTTASDIARWLYDRGIKGVSAAYIRQIRSVDARKDSQERRDAIRALPSGETAGDARQLYGK